jgi:hypothetical protein
MIQAIYKWKLRIKCLHRILSISIFSWNILIRKLTWTRLQQSWINIYSNEIGEYPFSQLPILTSGCP